LPVNASGLAVADVTGLVLVGGMSRRMGRDKATLPVAGTPLVTRVATALRAAGIDQILAVGGDGDAARVAGVRWVADRYPGEGPLGGIVSGLQSVSTRYALVTAVDLPFVTKAAVVQLLGSWKGSLDVVLGNDGERSQPLFSVIDLRVAASLTAAFENGIRSPHDALNALRVDVAAAVTDGQLADVDTPAELWGAVLSRGMGLRSNSMTELDAEVPEIDIAEFAVRRKAGLPVLDVREMDEWQTARVPGVIHVPLTELVDRVDEVPTEGELLVVCAKGGRSLNAATWLRGRGIDATNVDGGTDGWIAAGNPTESGS